MDAGDDLGERRLSRAVLAEQRVNFPGRQIEIDVRQHFDAAELLRDCPLPIEAARA